MSIALGQKVRDVVSGFTGIATHRAVLFSHADQICVAPAVSADGALIDDKMFDETQLEIVDPEIRIKSIEPEAPRFKYGDKVLDKISGFSGKIVGYAIYLNGCLRYGVQPQVTKKGTLPDSRWFSDANLILDKASQEIEDQFDKPNKKGGPTMYPQTRISNTVKR